MSRLFQTTLRINLDKPEGKKAWEYLVNRDRTKYRSYSDAIVAAINGLFDRENALMDDPYLETREKEDAFLERVLDTIREGLNASGAGLTGLTALLQGISAAQPVASANDAAAEEDLETALDFVNSL